MKYFSNLKHGWATLTIGDFTCRCSYIQDIPEVIINAYKEFQKNGYCIINIDNEGYETEIIFSQQGVCAVVYKGFNIYYNLGDYGITDAKTLIYELLKDIINNVDEWARWMCCEPNYEISVNCHRNRINNYINELLKEYDI